MKTLYSFVFTFLSLFTVAQSEGPNNAKVIENSAQSCLSCKGMLWNDLNNASTADGNNASVTLYSSGFCNMNFCFWSRHLMASQFNFNIPSNATITGVTAQVLRSADTIDVILDSSIVLMLNQLPISNNKAKKNSYWDGGKSPQYVTYGGSSDTWGATLDPNIINDPAFGILIKGYNTTSAVRIGYIDDVNLTVSYTVPTGMDVTQLHQMQVYYNKDNKSFDLNCNANDNVSIHIYNALGQELITKNIPMQAKTVVDASVLLPGVYFVKCSGNQGVITRKVIVD